MEYATVVHFKGMFYIALSCIAEGTGFSAGRECQEDFVETI